MIKRDTILANCLTYMGKPYVWGGESMEEGGYDCSGYAYNVMKDSGINVFRNTAEGYRQSIGVKVELKDKQPSDLLFFGKNGQATHIGIYAGDGMMYESRGGSKNTKENPGEGVVLAKITRKDLMEIRRIADDIFVHEGLDYSILFDPTYYSNRYADLKRAFGEDSVKLFNHFKKYGMREGRQACETFNVHYYKSEYGDLRTAFGNNLPEYYKHYVKYGYKEHRRTVQQYGIQLGPFIDRAIAEVVAEELNKLGYDTNLTKI